MADARPEDSVSTLTPPQPVRVSAWAALTEPGPSARRWLLWATVLSLAALAAVAFGVRGGWPAAVLLALVFVSAGAAVGGALAALRAMASKEASCRQHRIDLENQHAALLRDHQRLQADLEVARSIQRLFLPDPKRRPFPRDLRFAHSFLPEMAVGGDYYDFKAIDDHRLSLLLADVSGHGMSAAFITGLIKTTFESDHAARESAPRFMAEVNNVLERLTPASSFAAMICAVYDIPAHTLRFTNAGHNPVPMVLRAAARAVESVEEPVDLLAGVNPDMTYSEGEVVLAPGDKFVLCTDGVIDTLNPAGDRFGVARLHDLLRARADLPAPDLLAALLSALDAFAAGADRPDDVTVVIMEVLR